jgi:flagellin
MRIMHNMNSMLTQLSVNRNEKVLGSSLEKLSTGLRINKAKDDAAGLAVSENLRAQVRGTSQAIKNTEQGLAMLEIAEGAANQITNIAQRMRELAVQAANETLSATEVGYISTEYEALMAEADSLAANTQYSGINVTDGSGPVTLQIGANTNAADQLAVTFEDYQNATTGLNAQATITDAADASAAIDAVDAAMILISESRAANAATTNQLEHTLENLGQTEYNYQSAESRVRDVDFARETSNFSRAQILSQAGVAMLAQANAAPQAVLALFS